MTCAAYAVERSDSDHPTTPCPPPDDAMPPIDLPPPPRPPLAPPRSDEDAPRRAPWTPQATTLAEASKKGVKTPPSDECLGCAGLLRQNTELGDRLVAARRELAEVKRTCAELRASLGERTGR